MFDRMFEPTERRFNCWTVPRKHARIECSIKRWIDRGVLGPNARSRFRSLLVTPAVALLQHAETVAARIRRTTRCILRTASTRREGLALQWSLCGQVWRHAYRHACERGMDMQSPHRRTLLERPLYSRCIVTVRSLPTSPQCKPLLPIQHIRS